MNEPSNAQASDPLFLGCALGHHFVGSEGETGLLPQVEREENFLEKGESGEEGDLVAHRFDRISIKSLRSATSG